MLILNATQRAFGWAISTALLLALVAAPATRAQEGESTKIDLSKLAKQQAAQQEQSQDGEETMGPPTPPLGSRENPIPYDGGDANKPQEAPEGSVQLKPGESPQIKFDTPVFDFGRVRAGEDVVHDFWFSNAGTGPLELLKVKPACGCTTAGSFDKIVQPGETGRIPIKMSTNRGNGPMSKNVTVFTNCTGSGAQVTLKLSGTVWQPVTITPNRATFGRLSPIDVEQEQIRRLTLINNVESPADFSQVTSSNDIFKTSVEELEAGKKYELVVSVKGGLQPGSNTGIVSIDTGLADMPKLEIPVSAFLSSAVDVTPRRLTIAEGATTPSKRFVYVRNNTRDPLEISDIQSTSADLKIDLKETEPGKTFRLEVEFPAEFKSAESGEKITFKTNINSVPEIIIPVTERSLGPRPSVSSALQPTRTVRPGQRVQQFEAGPATGGTPSGE